METIAKRQTAFRFNSDLLDRLKVAAKREHKSLNKYVECLLMDLMYNEPNEKTKAEDKSSYRRSTHRKRKRNV